ncbi:MAG: hypothetical protein LC799_31150 [Actinobacteria bacterium]|nr:hypothetical protein [Actinomycetota bacterium]
MVSDGLPPSPAQARQEAADLRVGERTLLALRVVAILTVVVYATIGILTDPDVGPVIESPSVRILALEVFALLGVAGLVAVIVCRRPARREVFWLRESIAAAGGLPVLAGGLGLLGGFRPVLALSLITGLTTLLLLYVWRER